MSTDYYEVLGVDREATLGAIRQAFANLRAKVPEDARSSARNPDYKRLVNAYEVLSNAQSRASYDARQASLLSTDLEINVQASATQMSVMNMSQVLYLLVDVHPPKQEAETRFPLNLSLVIDRSTSMKGKRLERVKTAVNLIISQLGPEDVVSVVSFSDRAEVVVPSNKVKSKQAIQAQVSSIRASGGTEIFQGLAAGVAQLEEVSLLKHINHVILLTDGHTYGDAQQCLDLAHNTAVNGIGITAFGIGLEWNDQFLDKLVAPSGGQSGYIETPEQIITHLESRITGLGAIYAQNLRMQFNFPADVELQFGFKLVPFAQPLTTTNNNELKLGNIEGRAPLAFLLELAIHPHEEEKVIDIPLTFVAEIPSLQMQERNFEESFKLPIMTRVARPDPPHTLIKAVRMLNMYRMNEKVWQDMEAGQVEQATQRMRHLTTRLLEAGETRLAQQASVETERLAQMGTLSLEGRKRLRYGTRSLMTQSLKLDDGAE